MPHSERSGPLRGVRVLDLSEGIAGPFCAKLLGDLGADVVKVEQAGSGDVSRSFGPFPGGQPDCEQSASFFFLNTSKRSLVLDLGSATGIAQLRALIARYDIIIASDTAEQLASRGLGFERIHELINVHTVFR